MLFIGVDPGITGALAAVDVVGCRLVSCIPMPIRRFDTPSRFAVDPGPLNDWLDTIPHPQGIMIEHQQPMGDRGRPGSGKGDAMIVAAMVGIASLMLCVGVPIAFIAPISWKTRAALKRQSKEAALDRALMMFGKDNPYLVPRRGSGITKEVAIAFSDAALIAFYGARGSVPKSIARQARRRAPLTAGA